MNKFLLLLFSILAISCGRDKKRLTPAENDLRDSVAFYYLKAQDAQLALPDRLTQVDKAFMLFKNEPKDSVYSNLLYLKNWLNLSLGQYDSLLKYDRILIKHAQEIDDKSILALEYYFKGYYYDQVAQKPDSAFASYSQSKNYYLQLKDSSWVGKNLINMGDIQNNQSDYFGSKETLTDALKYLDSEKDSEWINSVLNELALNHRKLLNYQEAINYYKIVIKKDTTRNQLIYLNNLAAVYIDQKKYEKALSILNQIQQDSRFGQDKIQNARVLDNLAYAKWLSGISQTEEDFLLPLQLRKESKEKRGQIASFTHLGEYYSKINPERAMAYFDTVVNLSKTLAMPKAELDVLKILITIEPRNVQLRDRYDYLQDSLYTQKLKVKTQFAKYKYDNQLSNESVLRLEKEKAEKELDLAEQRYYKLWLGAGLVIALLLIALIAYLQKQRTRRLKAQNRADRLQATYETEAAISQRLHDDFGAGLNNVMLLLQRNSKDEKILDRVEDLYNQSRNFSRALNDIDTGAGYKEELKSMLSFQTPPEANLITIGLQPIDWSKIGELSKLTLFKILRELMINMKKHSGAKLVKITFSQTVNGLKITYTDNGKGASKEALILKNGLLITEKRIQAIGGTIIFDSEKGKGFNCLLEIPN